jgi:hypothetical protein
MSLKLIRFEIGMALAGMLALAAIAVVAAWPACWLWNWLMPSLFGWKLIGVWQAWGLIVLSGLLFKPWGLHSDK